MTCTNCPKYNNCKEICSKVEKELTKTNHGYTDNFFTESIRAEHITGLDWDDWRNLQENDNKTSASAPIEHFLAVLPSLIYYHNSTTKSQKKYDKYAYYDIAVRYWRLGESQTDIADSMDISVQTINDKIRRIKELYDNFLRHKCNNNFITV